MIIPPINPNAQVVFVGAGPVGLWTAIQTKLRDPHLEVDVLEKYSEYRRSHPLNINASSLKGCPHHPKLQQLVQQFIANKRLSTKTIEEGLTTFAQEIGIGIRKKAEIKDPDTLRQLYPQAKVIIGSDGAHSTVRKKIFGNQMSLRTDMKFMLDVKYEVVGRGKPLPFAQKVYPTLKAMESLAQEYIGRETNGKTPITLRLFIDRKKYEQLKEATFTHPYSLENEKLIQTQLLKNIHLWLNLKKQEGEVRVPGSEQITVTHLGMYASKEVVKLEKGVTWCLAGDAAFGVPFFRSLNNGLLEGTTLSEKIVQSLSSKPSFQDRLLSKFYSSQEELSPSFLGYSRYVKRLCAQEALLAWVKNCFLTLLQWYVQISSKVPWQVNYWSEEKILKLQKA